MTIATLQPLTLPLDGIRLIEASAGTGKTWTIAALYLRLVLGHGVPHRKPLLPPEILVLTFTRAATAELRERIRIRLAEAARAFRETAPESDDFLAALIADYPDPAARAQAARRLESAGQWMDEAAIHTIHGWCQRMLQQHAFDSGHPFAQDTQADESLLQAEAIRDYWRAQFFPLDRHAAARMRALWKTPRDLHRSLRPLLSQPEELLRLHGAVPPAVDTLGTWVEAALDAELSALAQARQAWREQADAIDATLLDMLRNGGLKANMMKPEAVEKDLGLLRQWSNGGAIDEKTLERYAMDRIASATRKGVATPDFAAFAAIEAWKTARENAPPLKPMVLAHAAPWVRRRLEGIKQQRAQIGFDDMLRHLADALDAKGGWRLAQTLATQYPVALIDEFQDTDPLQWRIFERIYTPRPDCGLLLIGDPKQAIYSFRGADIHTYLRARDAAQAPTWTLSTNYRSTHGMVDAINRLFAFGDRHADGAFGFGAALPFHPVAAHGRKEKLLRAGEPVPALTFALADSEHALGTQAYRQILADHAASNLVRQLDAAREGRYGFTSADGDMAPLRESDVAILVRGRSEAALMRDALHRRGLKSVFLSDRDSVYASPQADDLRRWLQASAEPSSDRAMRGALATASMCRRYDELDRLNTDESAWEACGEQFRELHAIWRKHGVLATVHDLLHRFDLPARLLALPDGERRLTNLLHLAELLQHAAAALDGERALIRYLDARIAEAQDAQTDVGEDQVVRLESEDALIKIVTIHKSKGLEYPVVMLPFVAVARAGGDGDLVVWHNADGVAVADLAADDAARAAAAREQSQEDLRLLYVALTRARHACWVGIGCYRIGTAKASMLHRSALGYLLSGNAPIERADLLAHLEHLAADSEDIAIEPLPADIDAHVYERRPDANTAQRGARHYRAGAIAPWRIASYSGMKYVQAETVTPAAPETAAQDKLNEAMSDTAVPALVLTGAPQGIHAFERGAQAGTFLHELFEWAAERGFAAVQGIQDELTAWIARRAQRHGWQRHARMLAAWLARLLKQPLALPDGGQMALDELGAGSYYAELEFWIETARVDTQRLDRLVMRHTLDGAARPLLSPETINGMLKGFIDLVFEHRGRYYIVDYKSNQLGQSASAYTMEAMRRSVLEERYDLQYALYTLALHRQLRARLPGYRYDTHVGGVMYLYLRGIEDDRYGVHRERLPFALVDALDRLFSGDRVHGE
ncbi:MAG TPA: exodeoxyribonuclease V subunit beta [Dyella sp.]|uniref:exodeoxyribonuclease V subunit beta n=1 Tax=Dyella sp. TaxID=1869338 RepID=UPI002F947871